MKQRLSITIITVLALSLVLTSGMALNGVLPGIRDALGITQSQSELIVTISPISSLIAVLGSTYTYRKLGMKRAVILGLLLIGFGGLVPVVIHYYPLILVGRFVLGIGMGTASPAAINYINLLVAPDLRPTIQGYRMSSSLIGQGALTLLAGGLFMISWNLAFVVYLVAFVVAFMVWKFIPDIAHERPTPTGERAEKLRLPKILVPIILFQVSILITAVAVEVRFPALAAHVRGGQFNSSFIIAMKASLGIFFGAIFGKFYGTIRRGVLYLGVFILVIIMGILGLFGNSFTILIVAFLMLSIVHAWVPPYVITTISKHTHTGNRTFAMSLFFASTNIGVFLMPFVVQWVEQAVGYTGLTAPYLPFAGYLLAMLVVMVVFRETAYKKRFGR